MKETSDTSNTGSTLSTFLVMICTLVSRLLGFLRIAVITAVFGATGKADIINLTFSIPNNFRKLLAEGALSSAFIPVLSASIHNDGSLETSRKIVQNIITFQLFILIPFCLLSIIFSDTLVSRVFSEFSDPEQIDLASSLFSWFILYLLFVSISAAMMGVINSHNKFFIPAVTPTLFSISLIAAILLLHPYLDVYAMVIGVLVGGVAQIAFQYPQFRRLGYGFRLNAAFNNPEFKNIMRRWLPVLATSSIFTITQTIAFRFATGLEDGSTSALTNALVFYQLPYGLFSASVTTVLFPRMSKQAAAQNMEGLNDSLQYGLRFLLILLVPSALVLSLNGREIIAVAIQRGQFTADNTVMTAEVLTGYCYGLYSVGAYNFTQRFFYSLGNYRTPLAISFFVALLDIGFSLWLKETPLRVAGLSIANSISFTAGLVFLLLSAKRLTGSLHMKRLLLTLGKIIVSLIPVYLFNRIFIAITGTWWVQGSTMINLGRLLIFIAVDLGVILGLYRLFRVEMFSVLFRFFTRKKP